MSITERLLAFTLLGLEWVLWLLIGLSILSIAVMVERFLALPRGTRDLDDMASSLLDLLGKGDMAGARRAIGAPASPEARVGFVGLTEMTRGREAAAEAMASAKSRERMALERASRARHARQQRAVHRPLRHGARHHQGLHRPRRATRAAGPTVMAASRRRWSPPRSASVAIPAVVAFNACRRVRRIEGARYHAHLIPSAAAQRGGRRRRPSSGKGRRLTWPAVRARSTTTTRAEIVDINVTPLVDIVLVLLIIFMVTATYIVNPTIKVDLPKAATGHRADAHHLGPDDRSQSALYLNGEKSDEAAVMRFIAAELPKNPELRRSSRPTRWSRTALWCG